MDLMTQLEPDSQGLLLSKLGEASDVEQLAQAVLEALAKAFWLEGQGMRLSTSIDTELFAPETDHSSHLVRQADASVTQARQKSDNCCHVHQASSQINPATEQWLATDLDLILDHRDVQMSYQPQFDLRSGQLIGEDIFVHHRLSLMIVANLLRQKGRKKDEISRYLQLLPVPTPDLPHHGNCRLLYCFCINRAGGFLWHSTNSVH